MNDYQKSLVTLIVGLFAIVGAYAAGNRDGTADRRERKEIEVVSFCAGDRLRIFATEQDIALWWADDECTKPTSNVKELK